jgi:hypothetical protein
MENNLVSGSFVQQKLKSMTGKCWIWMALMLLGFLACTSTKTGAVAHTSKTAVPEVPWVLKHNRGPCFGQCPVFDFYLLNDHTGLIDVKANLLEPGWYEAALDQESLHYLLADIEDKAWWDADLSGEPVIADLPALSLYYKHKEGLRSFVSRGQMNDAHSRVFQQLSHLVTEARWKPTEKRPLSPDLPQPTDLIVLLKEGVNVQQWMKKYEDYGIRLKRRLNPTAQYYVVTKASDKGTANDFYQHIKLDEDVVDAQWDKRVEPRN